MIHRTSGWFAAGFGLLAAACSVGDASTDRAGNPVEATVVTIGTEEIGDAAIELLTLFADRVDALSEGRIRVEFDLGIVGGGTAWDQRAIEMTANGEYDGVVARAGAWHTGGVTTLDPLQLPGVVDSDIQAARLVRDGAVVDGLLAGLEEVGFVGLGLYPEAPRYLMLLDGTDDFSLQALRGREVRAATSETVFEVLSAMGMRPVDIAPEDFVDAVTSGRVTATEGHLARVALTTTIDGGNNAAVAVNLPLYTKFLVLAMRDDAVPGDVLETLRRAASDTVNPFLDQRPNEATAAVDACAVGGSLVEVPNGDQQALFAAVEPVVEATAAGPNGDLLQAVRVAVGDAEGPSPTCPAAPTETTTDRLRTSPERRPGDRHDVRIDTSCARLGCHHDASRYEELQ